MSASGGEIVPEVIRELMIVERSVGSTLSQSLKSPGGLSPLVHGTNGVREQVVLYAAKAVEKTGGGITKEKVILAAVVAGVSIGGTLFFTKVVPKIKQSMADKKAQIDADESVDEAGVEIATQPAPTSEVSRQAGDEIEESGITVESTRWYELFFEALAHRAASNAYGAISAEQWMTLMTARVVDDEDTQALASAMRELAPDEINEKVDLILEQHPELLTEDPGTVVERLFGDEADELLIPIRATSADDVLLDSPTTSAVKEPELIDDDDDSSDEPDRAP